MSDDRSGSEVTPVPAASTPADSTALTLRTLAPKYQEPEHGVYVQALVDAIEHGPSMRNVALTGAYGTGKSSVLTEVASRYEDRALTLSLSTVGLEEEPPEGKLETNPAAWTKTNRIQKEIVKQILYRDSPARTRGSRFRRIARFRPGREVWVALGGGLLLLAVFYLTQLSKPLVAVGGKGPWSLGFAYVVLFLVLAGIVFALRWITHNRVFLEKLTAGPATVALTSESSSFFDQYMDEIVYYFERSGHDLVIFEDIDRFEDVHIFETLRSLNALLNGSEQVRNRVARPKRKKDEKTPELKFIYALRDSVFEKIGVDEEHSNDAAEDEIERANRTKFFDLVIPIVPFITSRNARDLMSADLAGTGISAGIVDVAARHVADMRLIIDMRNEYDVYANRLLGTPNQMPGLDPDKLFALILYKSVHMGDFEEIRLGKSKLDKLHDAWRLLVDESLKDATARQTSARDGLHQQEQQIQRAQRLGDRLDELARALASHPSYPDSHQISAGGQPKNRDELRTSEFWRDLATDKPNISIANPHRNQSAIGLDFGRFQALMGESLDAAEWDEADRLSVRRAERRATEEITFLRHHSWGEIYSQPKFKADLHGPKPESFAEATARLLESRLARDLVANGYLDDYFALYVSVYYGTHLRLDALNFVVHALDVGRADINYRLEPDDVDAILRDKGESILLDRAIYNISILDHLLATNREHAETVIWQIAAWQREDQAFAKQYVATGGYATDFVRLLAAVLPQIVTFVLEDADVPEETRVALVDAALSRESDSIDYVPSLDLPDFVLTHYADFESITKKGFIVPKPGTMKAIAALGLKLPDVTALNDYARSKAIELRSYAINELNLKTLANGESISLDHLRSANARIYEAVLADLDDYVVTVEGSRPRQLTVAAVDAFSAVLNDVDGATSGGDGAELSEIIRLASKSCRIDVLTDAPQRAWPSLVSEKRTVPSAANLLAYLDAFEAIDQNVGALLTGVREVTDATNVEEADRLRLATAILNAPAAIQSPAKRITLARSLQLTASISPESLVPETGELAGRLISAGLVADDEATFASSLMPDWTAREHAIRRSKRFGTFFSPAVLPTAQLPDFFLSQHITRAQKRAVLADLDSYFVGAKRDAYQAAAHYAIKTSVPLDGPQIDRLRAAGVSPVSIIALLAASTDLPMDDVRAVLRALGGDYAAIADPGRKLPPIRDDVPHRQVLDRLKAEQIVSDYKPEKGRLRVSLHHS